MLYLQRNFIQKYTKEKDYRKVREHSHYTGKCRNLHSGSNFDYHFIVKQLEKEFEEEFNCLQSFKKYLRQALVFMWGNAIRVGFNFFFRGIFAGAGKILRELG